MKVHTTIIVKCDPDWMYVVQLIREGWDIVTVHSPDPGETDFIVDMVRIIKP